MPITADLLVENLVIIKFVFNVKIRPSPVVVKSFCIWFLKLFLYLVHFLEGFWKDCFSKDSYEKNLTTPPIKLWPHRTSWDHTCSWNKLESTLLEDAFIQVTFSDSLTIWFLRKRFYKDIKIFLIILNHILWKIPFP